MKILKYILVIATSFVIASCSEDIMDNVNREQNDALEMDAKNLLPDILLKSAHETTGNDLAWYATVYVEHSAGTWGQSADADNRLGQNVSSVFNNAWNRVYDLLNICKIILDKTDPENGSESENYWVRGVAQVVAAYNLAVATDMWGEVPWTEACRGSLILKPKYENQSTIYGHINDLLDDAILNISKSTVVYRDKDFIYGDLPNDDANKEAWVKAAYSLKARYHMRLLERNPNASIDALAAIANGFTSLSEGFIFAKYEAANTKSNPWWEFRSERNHLSVSQTLLNIMTDRNDPRISIYFTTVDGNYVGAPNGEALEVQTGIYSRSMFTAGTGAFPRTQPTPLMSFYELKFIEAEAKFRTSDPTWETSLEEAIAASFLSKGLNAGSATDYFTNEVAPLLTPGNELTEIMIQKYIAMYEAEAMEAYHDYRRTGIPEMNNPNNALVGFVNRLPYPLSEQSSNSANVPSINVFNDKVWWAGGQELIP